MITGPGPYSPETVQRLEQAAGAHHEILCCLQRTLKERGWRQIGQIAGAADLIAIDPDGRGRVFFEAKSLTAVNHLKQSRAALGQLFEYRFQHGQSEDPLCLACDFDLDPERAALLDGLGVAVITVAPEGVDARNTTARLLGLGPSKSSSRSTT